MTQIQYTNALLENKIKIFFTQRLLDPNNPLVKALKHEWIIEKVKTGSSPLEMNSIAVCMIM